MKKRLAKVLALGLTAAMVAGTPLSAMASEVNAADQAGETAVVAESADSADETEVDAGIASQDQNDASQDPVVNGVDPMSLDGVIQLDDGNWYYFNHGKWQYVNGLYPNSAGWWYVEDGQVDFSHEGLESYGGSDWYVKNGQIQFDYNGPLAMTITDEGADETHQTIYYISNGRVDTGFTGLAQATLNGEDGWFYFQNGMWDQYPDTSLAEYGGSWWYIAEGGKIDFNYNGTAYFNDVEWYVEGGRVDFSFTGRAEGDQLVADGMEVPFQTYFVNGMQQMDLTGVYYTEVKGNYGWYGFYKGQLASRDWYYGPTIGYVLSNASGWWYINPETGLVDFNYTGLAENDYGIWYMNNGQIDFGYNGFVKQRPYKLDFGHDYYDLYAVTGGKVDCNYDGILWTTIDGVPGWYGFVDGWLASDQALMKKDDGTWWYVGENGMVDFTYTGRAQTAYGEYYIRNGQIDFGFNGTLQEMSGTYKCYQNGKMLEWDFNGLVETTVDDEYGWYYVKNGYIMHDHNNDKNENPWYELVSNDAGWWAVSNGKVDFSYTGFVYDNVNETNGAWYVRNGQIDFGANGFIKDPASDIYYYYVVNGYVNHELYTVAQGTINGETAWWCVEGGGCVPNAFTGTAEYGGKVWYYDNSKIDFSKSGTYEHSQGLMRNDSTYVSIHYMYEVVNGQVITMTVHVAEGDQLQQ